MAGLVDVRHDVVAEAELLIGSLRRAEGKPHGRGVHPVFTRAGADDEEVTVRIGAEHGEHVLVDGQGLRILEAHELVVEPALFAGGLEAVDRFIAAVLVFLGIVLAGEVVGLAFGDVAVHRDAARAGAGRSAHLDAGLERAADHGGLAVTGDAGHDGVLRVDVEFLASALFEGVDDTGDAPAPGEQFAGLFLPVFAVGIQIVEEAGVTVVVSGDIGDAAHETAATAEGHGSIAAGGRDRFLRAVHAEDDGPAAFRHFDGVAGGRERDIDVERAGLAGALAGDGHGHGLAAVVVAFVHLVGDVDFGAVVPHAVHVVFIKLLDLFGALGPVVLRHVGAVAEFHDLRILIRGLQVLDHRETAVVGLLGFRASDAAGKRGHIGSRGALFTAAHAAETAHTHAAAHAAEAAHTHAAETAHAAGCASTGTGTTSGSLSACTGAACGSLSACAGTASGSTAAEAAHAHAAETAHAAAEAAHRGCAAGSSTGSASGCAAGRSLCRK